MSASAGRSRLYNERAWQQIYFDWSLDHEQEMLPKKLFRMHIFHATY